MGGYVWYTWDSDGDGVWNRNDEFPTDSEEWLDTDGDGYGDNEDRFPGEKTQWRDRDRDAYGDNQRGKNPDAFPRDLAASKDTDGDGSPDAWNSGKDADDSTSTPPLRLDDFPNNPAASLDTDGDGYPDEWNEGKTQSDSATGLHLDAFPTDENEWIDTDGDKVGDNGDDFPNNPTVWLDSDGDGIADEYESAQSSDNISGVQFDWVDIYPGTFMMGSPPGQGNDNEHPQHQVTISKGFQMLKFEVTQGQWVAMMGDNPPDDYPNTFGIGDDYPVYYMSWDECQSFISKLNELDSNHTYRLPTEAEWEYAARAGTDTKYTFGNDSGQLGQYAWYNDNSNDKTHPVGEKKPNPWGLYDMHGNVWEWVQDWYDSDYYSSSPGTDPQGPNSGSLRVFRGGSWDSYAVSCRSALRLNYGPDFRYYYLGLRLVREASGKT